MKWIKTDGAKTALRLTCVCVLAWRCRRSLLLRRWQTAAWRWDCPATWPSSWLHRRCWLVHTSPCLLHLLSLYNCHGWLGVKSQFVCYTCYGHKYTHMHAYMHACMHTHMHACMHTHKRNTTYTHKYSHSHTYPPPHTQMHALMHAHTHACKHTHSKLIRLTCFVMDHFSGGSSSTLRRMLSIDCAVAYSTESCCQAPSVVFNRLHP